MPTLIIQLPVEEIISSYKNGNGCLDIALKYNVNPSTIRNRLIQNGIKLRTSKETTKFYSYNEDFFASDTKASCYIAGLLAADCGIDDSSDVNSDGICLGQTDFILALLFKRELNDQHPIGIYQPSNRKLRFGNKILSNKLSIDLLERFNVHPRKSLTLQFPTRLKDSEYFWDFIRGYSDGDGCVSYNDKANEINWSLATSEIFARTLKPIIDEKMNFDVKAKRVRYNGSGFVLSYGGNQQLKRLFKELYANANDLYLPRKYDKIKQKFPDFPDLPLAKFPKCVKIKKRIFFEDDPVFTPRTPKDKINEPINEAVSSFELPDWLQ